MAQFPGVIFVTSSPPYFQPPDMELLLKIIRTIADNTQIEPFLNLNILLSLLTTQIKLLAIKRLKIRHIITLYYIFDSSIV